MALLLVALFIGARLLAAQNPSLDSATSDFQAAHFDSALTKLDQSDRTNGDSAESLDLRGQIALEQENLTAAEQAFTAAHKKSPELFAPRLHLADTLLREKKYSAARDIYEKLARETNILTSSERLNYALLVDALASQDRAAADAALANIKFPTETPAYYFAQAANDFAADNEASAKKWIATARKIFSPQLCAWFARPLFDLGWLKEKPPPPTI